MLKSPALSTAIFNEIIVPGLRGDPLEFHGGSAGDARNEGRERIVIVVIRGGDAHRVRDRDQFFRFSESSSNRALSPWIWAVSRVVS